MTSPPPDQPPGTPPQKSKTLGIATMFCAMSVSAWVATSMTKGADFGDKMSALVGAIVGSSVVIFVLRKRIWR